MMKTHTHTHTHTQAHTQANTHTHKRHANLANLEDARAEVLHKERPRQHLKPEPCKRLVERVRAREPQLPENKQRLLQQVENGGAASLQHRLLERLARLHNPVRLHLQCIEVLPLLRFHAGIKRLLVCPHVPLERTLVLGPQPRRRLICRRGLRVT